MTTSKAVGLIERKHARVRLAEQKKKSRSGEGSPQRTIHSQASGDGSEEEEGAGSWQGLKI